MRSLTITIAGQRLSLRTDAEEAYVSQLAESIDKRIRELKRSSKGVTNDSAALLTALQLADELARERQDRSELRRRVREKSKSILDYLRREVKL